MKLFHQYIIVLILGLFQIALAVQVQKSFIVSYPENTPDWVLNEAKKAITAAGGWITHEFILFKGFAAKAPSSVIETIQTSSNNFPPVIEEDQVVTINGDFGTQ
ncbi:hypothetical protein EYB25_005778 [Talaromyces marneffei]|uniref:Inhibitor I9 domain-containing protein n=1 Tax=Talaromyces marneffei (strain ATCC 18224 / CBS 334.59 / QM 7333) TaxID=441960 RepID=B6QI21_TALMQ|nr:uncharacterized protein EYB26_006927 [Talaromyces marneffei]EEA23016.1 conserved hypothetical protein [Talaromyces marneffei ATCC 18224]KAE8551887.1 hypothetical protein EYB25_005778 [Talaromyces marneffei]QGA19239.1 hypothetical protein EYB26_006927 [Talaromyces marneffei]